MHVCPDLVQFNARSSDIFHVTCYFFRVYNYIYIYTVSFYTSSVCTMYICISGSHVPIHVDLFSCMCIYTCTCTSSSESSSMYMYLTATVFNNANQHINVYGDDIEVDYRGYEVYTYSQCSTAQWLCVYCTTFFFVGCIHVCRDFREICTHEK